MPAEDEKEELQKSDELSEKRQGLSAQSKSRNHTAVTMSYAIAFVIVAAVMLSFPFPFVRRIWMKEIWGLYGMINALCFVVIANRLNHRNVSFAFVGLGLLIYDQILSWHGVWYLWTQQSLDLRIAFYVGLSLGIAALFLLAFGSAIYSIYQYQVFKCTELKLYETGKEPARKTSVIVELLISAAIYGCVYAAIQQASFMEPKQAYGIMRILGGITAFMGFFVIGRTVDSISKKREHLKSALLKIAVHGISLGLIQWMICRLLPLTELIQY